MYIKNTCRIKDKIEIEKHYPGKFGAPGIKREPKRKRTPEEMAKQNLWRKLRNLRRLMEINFSPGDFHVTLTCQEDKRPSVEEAPKVIRDFRNKLRKTRLDDIAGCEMNYNSAGEHKTLLLNYCRYDLAGKNDEFEKNYRTQLNNLLIDKEIEAYAEQNGL